MTESIFRIVYCSRNTLAAGTNVADLDQILATSRRNNQAVGVTGALLYTDGLFAQTLEGDFDAVQSVFERIQADPRHDDVVVLQAETVADRIFGSWAMAQAKPQDPASAHATLARAFVESDSRSAGALVALLNHVVRCVPA